MLANSLKCTRSKAIETGSRGPARQRRRGGFTLVEMMVVIAVIVVLASLLLPGLSAARENARTTQCQSNLMQMLKAWMMYSDVHNGMMMPVTTYVYGNPANAPQPNLQNYWFGQVLVPQSASVPGTLDVNQGFLAPYLVLNQAYPARLLAKKF